MMMTTTKMVLGGAAGLMMYVENFCSCIRMFLSKKLLLLWGGSLYAALTPYALLLTLR